MQITHHQSPAQFQCYVVNSAWRDRVNTESDPEAEAHPARTFSLWASGHHTADNPKTNQNNKRNRCKPPVTNSVPDALGRMNETHENAFGSLKQTATSINFQRQLILKELKTIRGREEVG